MIITIDGPTASGKSTLAKNLAKKLDFYYINTGFLYRALAYILTKELNYDEKKLMNPNNNDIEFILDPERFSYSYNGNEIIILFNNKNITNNLKTPEIDKFSSIISSNKEVRKQLLTFQLVLSKKYDIIIEGRDTGSVVFPDADFKFYLTASLDVRAKRWQEEMKKIGKKFDLEESKKIVFERDERDKIREHSPLVIPKNAIIIDSSTLSADELLEEVVNIIKKNND